MAMPVTVDPGGEDVLGILPSDAERIARVLQAFESGSLWQKPIPYRPPPRIPFAGIPFRNDNAGTAPAWGVMRITGASTDGYLTVDQPDTSLKRLYLVNGGDDVGAGLTGTGSFLTSDHFSMEDNYILYDTGTPAVDESWGPKNGQWTLTKWGYGFTIMGANDTDVKRTIAVQQFVNKVRGKTNGSISKGGTGTVDVYDGNSAAMTSVQLTGVVNDILTVATTKIVYVDWISGKWCLSTAECPVA